MNVINLLMRLFARKATNWGIRAGTDMVARRSGGTTAAGKMSPGAKKQARDMREAAKRARMAARITRRMGR